MRVITADNLLGGIRPLAVLSEIRPLCVPLGGDTSFADEVAGHNGKPVYDLWQRLGLFFLEEQPAEQPVSRPSVIVNNFSSSIILQLFSGKNQSRVLAEGLPSFSALNSVVKKAAEEKRLANAQTTARIMSSLKVKASYSAALNSAYNVFLGSQNESCSEETLICALKMLLRETYRREELSEREEALFARITELFERTSVSSKYTEQLRELLSGKSYSRRERLRVLSALKSDISADTAIREAAYYRIYHLIQTGRTAEQIFSEVQRIVSNPASGITQEAAAALVFGAAGKEYQRGTGVFSAEFASAESEPEQVGQIPPVLGEVLPLEGDSRVVTEQLISHIEGEAAQGQPAAERTANPERTAKGEVLPLEGDRRSVYEQLISHIEGEAAQGQPAAERTEITERTTTGEVLPLDGDSRIVTEQLISHIEGEAAQGQPAAERTENSERTAKGEVLPLQGDRRIATEQLISHIEGEAAQGQLAAEHTENSARTATGEVLLLQGDRRSVYEQLISHIEGEAAQGQPAAERTTTGEVLPLDGDSRSVYEQLISHIEGEAAQGQPAAERTEITERTAKGEVLPIEGDRRSVYEQLISHIEGEAAQGQPAAERTENSERTAKGEVLPLQGDRRILTEQLISRIEGEAAQGQPAAERTANPERTATGEVLPLDGDSRSVYEQLISHIESEAVQGQPAAERTENSERTAKGEVLPLEGGRRSMTDRYDIQGQNHGQEMPAGGILPMKNTNSFEHSVLTLLERAVETFEQTAERKVAAEQNGSEFPLQKIAKVFEGKELRTIKTQLVQLANTVVSGTAEHRRQAAYTAAEVVYNLAVEVSNQAKAQKAFEKAEKDREEKAQRESRQKSVGQTKLSDASWGEQLSGDTILQHFHSDMTHRTVQNTNVNRGNTVSVNNNEFKHSQSMTSSLFKRISSYITDKALFEQKTAGYLLTESGDTAVSGEILADNSEKTGAALQLLDRLNGVTEANTVNERQIVYPAADNAVSDRIIPAEMKLAVSAEKDVPTIPYNADTKGRVLPASSKPFVLNRIENHIDNRNFSVDSSQHFSAMNIGGNAVTLQSGADSLSVGLSGDYRSRLDSKTLQALDAVLGSASAVNNAPAALSQEIVYASRYDENEAELHKIASDRAITQSVPRLVGIENTQIMRILLIGLRAAAAMKRELAVAAKKPSGHLAALMEFATAEQGAKGSDMLSGSGKFTFRTIDSGENMVMLIPPTEMDRYQAESGYNRNMPPIELKTPPEPEQKKPAEQPQRRENYAAGRTEVVKSTVQGGFENMSREDISRLADKVYSQIESRILRERRRMGM